MCYRLYCEQWLFIKDKFRKINAQCRHTRHKSTATLCTNFLVRTTITNDGYSGQACGKYNANYTHNKPHSRARDLSPTEATFSNSIH